MTDFKSHDRRHGAVYQAYTGARSHTQCSVNNFGLGERRAGSGSGASRSGKGLAGLGRLARLLGGQGRVGSMWGLSAQGWEGRRAKKELDQGGGSRTRAGPGLSQPWGTCSGEPA